MLVFITIFVYLGLFEWILYLLCLLPFDQADLLNSIPRVLIPEGVLNPLTHQLPGVIGLLGVTLVRLAMSFFYGIFILLLLNMITGFSGIDPYDRTSMLLGLLVSPWVIISRRLFPFARIGIYDFSIAILLFLIWTALGIIDHLLLQLLVGPGL
jgi:hypothetical protein